MPPFPVRCLVGVMKDGLPLPTHPVWSTPGPFVQAIRNGARATTGAAAAIDFALDARALDACRIPADTTTTAFHLHDSLIRLSLAVPGDDDRQDVALLYADRYEADPDNGTRLTLGLMFDRGFAIPGSGETPVDS